MSTGAPGPEGARDLDELAARLRELRVWAGVSYRELHRRIVRARTARGVAEVPVYDTVYRCLQPGRSRLDVELVVDVVRALTDDQAAASWRQAFQAITGTAADAAVVNVADRLPDERPGFTGREAELRRICQPALEEPVVVVIDGMAGVGKTSLAVHAAHRLMPRAVVFAVDLRGDDPARSPADPGAVLDVFLKSLGCRSGQLAGLDLQARTARFRDLLLGKRALILLDNAASTDQLLPLLPRTPGSTVLITSRTKQNLPAAVNVSLEPLTSSESVQLLRRELGQDQDPEALRQLAEYAGHLPLALALIAGRIGSSPEWTLTDHLDRLADRRRGLRLDDQIEVALAQSYKGLSADHRRLLRRLSLHPGEDWDAAAAAALTGFPTAEAELEELADRSLLQRRSPGRYGLHDLVRVFAAQRVRDDEPARLRRDASTALLDHYRRTAAAAMTMYAPQEAAWRPEVAETTGVFADRGAARLWLDSERINLIACGLYAAEHGWPDHVADLSGILYRYLDDTGQYTDGEKLHQAAVRVAAGTARGRALSSLGVAYWRLGTFGKARNVYQEALGIAAAAGDRREEIRALINLGLVNERSGDYHEALAGYWTSIEICHEIGSRLATAQALQNVVHLDERLGRYRDALEHSSQCLEILAEIDDRPTEGRVRNGRALALLGLGETAAAVAEASAAAEIAKTVGNRVGEAYALLTIGRALRKQGELERARQTQQAALAIAREMSNQDCEAQALNDLGSTQVELGDADDAVRLHRAALTIAVELGDPYERARSHQGLGKALVRQGDRAGGRSELSRAATLYGGLGTPEGTETPLLT
ncbi:tetratricopeptide repeat protein [Kribbella sp. NPDC006257]|uniref:tetratricopeptide repeat protein n=1 Tax=Kribbella sp. NPDC006257 TaxID=3156738 RepID=UPI0033A83F14